MQLCWIFKLVLIVLFVCFRIQVGFAFVFTARPEPWQVFLPSSKASEVPIHWECRLQGFQLNATVLVLTSCLTKAKTSVPAPAWSLQCGARPLGLFQYPPLRAPAASAHAPFCFSALSWFQKQTHTIFCMFRAGVIPASHFQMSTSKHTFTEGTWKPIFYPEWKALFWGIARVGNTSPSSGKTESCLLMGLGASQGHVTWVVIIYCYWGPIMCQILYWVLYIHSMSFNPLSSPVR